MTFEARNLPCPAEPAIESGAVLKKLALASCDLAKLKGEGVIGPNASIPLASLTLQAAKDSSEAENIVITQDALYQAAVHARWGRTNFLAIGKQDRVD